MNEWSRRPSKIIWKSVHSFPIMQQSRVDYYYSNMRLRIFYQQNFIIFFNFKVIKEFVWRFVYISVTIATYKIHYQNIHLCRFRTEKVLEVYHLNFVHYFKVISNWNQHILSGKKYFKKYMNENSFAHFISVHYTSIPVCANWFLRSLSC